jgi:hypothetical protein
MMAKPVGRVETNEATLSITSVQTQISNQQYERRMLAIGDSWFDKFTPLFGGGQDMNLLSHLRLTRAALVVDAAKIGRLACDYETKKSRKNIARYAETWDFQAILVSLGGNDIIATVAKTGLELLKDLATKAIRPTPTQSVAEISGAVKKQLPKVMSCLATILAEIRAGVNAKTPVVFNTYDYPTARPAPSFVAIDSLAFPFTRGPWLYPALAALALTIAECEKLVKDVLNQFQVALGQFVDANGGGQAGLYVARSQGVLRPAGYADVGVTGDWADEIHASPAGYDKI